MIAGVGRPRPRDTLTCTHCSTSKPGVKHVHAAITYTHASVDYRLCQGEQGPFREARVRVVGESTGDPQLTGKATATLRYLWHDETGDGYQRGTLVFRDARTGHMTAQADFVDASVAEIAQGVLVGSVQGGGRTLIANWRTTWHENGAVTAEVGGVAGDARLPAVLVGGHCTGPFTHLEEDFPPPGAAVAAVHRAGDGYAGWLRH